MGFFFLSHLSYFIGLPLRAMRSSWSYCFCLSTESGSPETFSGLSKVTQPEWAVGGKDGGSGQTLASTSGGLLFFFHFLLSFRNMSCHFLEPDSLALVGEGGAIQE